MGDGTLPREAFKNYMIQDYLYLVYMACQYVAPHLLTHTQIQFARANALASYKSTSLDDIAAVRGPTILSSKSPTHADHVIRARPS
jgi:thiaminase